jgi:hypothetical protein
MDLAVWRDVSLLWLCFLAFLAVLPWGIAFFFSIRGMTWLRRQAKKYFPIVQDGARQVAGTTERISQKVVAPVIGARSAVAQVHGIQRATFRRKQA